MLNTIYTSGYTQETAFPFQDETAYSPELAAKRELWEAESHSFIYSLHKLLLSESV